MKIEGACHCGAIAYEAEVDPEGSRVCHCTDCQTIGGAAFRQVVPTGFSSVPPPGPAIPLTETARSVLNRRRAPRAISSTVSRLTAPREFRVSHETSNKATFAS